MLPDRVSNPGPLTYESGALPIALRGPAWTQEVEGSTPTGDTCSNDFSDPTDKDIRTQLALSWKIVVSE